MDKNPENIAGMFNAIAPQYDFLNHFLSLGIDRYWRRRLVRRVRTHSPSHILDVATGTGDLAILLQQKTGAAVTGIDIAEGMMDVARKKTLNSQLSTLNFQLASASALPFPDNTFDAVTVAFGVRNFENLQQGLSEMLRVLRPGGLIAILEFTTPRTWPVRPLYRWYSRHIIPLLGRLVSKHAGAYSYLPASVEAFPQREKFLAELEQVRFQKTNCKTFTCGICGFYTAVK